MDISRLRREYDTTAPLTREDLAPDPFTQFQRWLQEACDADLLEPNAMSLATVSASGAPSSRTVLLKYFDPGGFVFFTNLESAKAHDIAVNDQVALLFPWLGLQRQVAIAGSAARISTSEALKYFISRPRGSQIGSWVSQQSSVVSSRSLLEAKFDEIRRKFASGDVPLPSFWGGYRVRPARLEFWQGRPNRLHDRLLYTRDDADEWRIDRLAP